MEYLGNLRMKGSFQEIKSVGLVHIVPNQFGTQPGTAIVGLSVHIDIDRTGVECACKIEQSPLMDALGVANHLRGGLLEAAVSPAAELHLLLKIG